MSLLPPLVGELRVKASDVHVKFGEVIKASDEMAKKTSGDSTATGSAWDKLGRTSKVALSAIGTGIVGMIGTTGEMAGNFQENMTKLVTGAGVSKDAIGGISQGILDMAPKVQTSTDQLSSGMYMIASAGFKGADGMSILQAAAEGAKVGAADLGTTADALTTVMTDYHLPANQAADVTSKLVATVANGKTHMQDLAGSMSHVLPFAAGLGISLNDTMGAMATMTGQGIQADQAATYLKFTMMALANETPKGAKALKEVGLSSKQVADDLKSKGLHGTLDEITEAIGKKFPKGSAEYTAALADIVGGTRGMASALALTGQNAETYNENIKKIGEATAEAGGHVEGFGEASEDMNSKMEGVRAKVEVLGIKIGTALIPALSSMIDGAGAAFSFLDSHKAILVTIASIIGGMLTVIVIAWGLKFVETTKTVITAVGKVGSAIGSGLGDGIGSIGRMASSLKNAGAAAMEWASTTTKAIAANSKELAINSLEWLKNTAATVSSKVAQIASTVATAAMTAGQWLLNAAMSANPIMIVVIAIAALVGALIWAYNNVGWFKDMVNAAWAGIQVAVKVVVDWFVGSVLPWLSNVWTGISAGVTWLYDAIFKPYFDMIVAVVTVLVNFVTGTLVPGIEGAFQWIGSVVSGAVSFFTNFQQNAINAAAGVLTWFENLPGALMSALSDAGSWLLGVGQNIVQGLIQGVQSMIGNVVSTIQNGIGGAVDAVKNALGIHSPSTVFHDIGRNTMLGYLNGINAMSGDVSDALTSAVLPQFGGSFGGGGGFAPQPVSATQQAGSGGGTVINHYYTITVPVTTNADPNEIARGLGWQLSQMK